MGQLGPLASLAGRDIGMKNPSDVYLGILRSRTIADSLIRRFSLSNVYHSRTMTDARSELADHSRILTGQDSLIRIAVDDHDPKRASDLANGYVEELFRQNSKLATTESAQRRLFFERQMESEKNDLAAAEEALRQTQQQTGLLQVTGQVEALVGAAARLRAEIGSREVAIERLKESATPENPEVVRQYAELTALSAQLRKLESGVAARPNGSPIIPTAGVPQAGLLYVRALRDVKYHEALYEVYAKQFEAAKIDEAKEAPAIQVVDAAVIPDKKSWPPRALFVAAAAFLSGLIASLFVIARAHLSEVHPLAVDTTGARGVEHCD